MEKVNISLSTPSDADKLALSQKQIWCIAYFCDGNTLITVNFKLLMVWRPAHKIPEYVAIGSRAREDTFITSHSISISTFTAVCLSVCLFCLVTQFRPHETAYQATLPMGFARQGYWNLSVFYLSSIFTYHSFVYIYLHSIYPFNHYLSASTDLSSSSVDLSRKTEMSQKPQAPQLPAVWVFPTQTHEENLWDDPSSSWKHQITVESVWQVSPKEHSWNAIRSSEEAVKRGVLESGAHHLRGKDPPGHVLVALLCQSTWCVGFASEQGWS